MAIDLTKTPNFDVYVTVEAYTVSDFDTKCNALSEQGFKRVGEIIIGGGGYTFFQQWMKEKPVIIEEEGEEPDTKKSVPKR